MNSRQTTTVVAAVQATPIWCDRDACIAKTVSLIGKAAAKGARLVAFPETWIPAYPAYIYGAAGWDDPEAKDAHRVLLENSITVPSAATDLLCAAAREHGVFLVVGINERDGVFSRGTIYNSQLFIDDQGRILGVHRKLWPTHAERLVWGQGDGSTLHVFDTKLGRVGGLICWEHWMPLARFAMHAKGEQIHIASWPDLGEMHQVASRHYAFEGRCFVLCVGLLLSIDDVPEGFPARRGLLEVEETGAGDGVVCAGGTGIIAPDGSWLAGPVVGEEAIVCAEIDLADVSRELMALDAAGHYNRTDIFRLVVDDRPRPQVWWMTEDDTAGAEA